MNVRIPIVLMLALATLLGEGVALRAVAGCGPVGGESIQAGCCCKPATCDREGQSRPAITAKCCDFRVSTQAAETSPASVRSSKDPKPAPVAAPQAPNCEPAPAAVRNEAEDTSVPCHSPPRYRLFCSYLI